MASGRRESFKAIPFPEIENAYVLFSAKQHPSEPGWCVSTLSFLYDAGEVAAEWQPDHGPIQVWYKGTGEETDEKHYFYDTVDWNQGTWSQMAVYENNLPAAFIRGDYKYIFAVLSRWAKERD